MFTDAHAIRPSLERRTSIVGRPSARFGLAFTLLPALALWLPSRTAAAQGAVEPAPQVPVPAAAPPVEATGDATTHAPSIAPPGTPEGTGQAEASTESLVQKPAATPSDEGTARAASVPVATPAVPSAAAKDPSAAPAKAEKPSAWHFGGYGELLLMTSFYHPDLTRRDSNYRDTRLDLRRVALAVDADLTDAISFRSEIEIEHGGTGVAREIEWEEFGEYETEVEKGGEIALEEAYLEGRVTPWLSVSAGHLLIPVGMTVGYHKPNLFSSTRRPESEAQLLPSLWHENGVEVSVQKAGFRARLQAVTGLDSTGFSSSRWIAGGTQRTFEEPQMNDIATVVAVDYIGVPGLLLGASFYTSGTNKNRPKRDLYDVSGRVTLGDFHARFQRGPLKLRGVVLLGHLENAEAITRANASLSSELGASRTAVGRGAYATWIEGAYDVLPLIAGKTRHVLDVFARFDAFDTMWRSGSSFDNPMMQRRTVTTGLNYFPHPRVVLKGEYVSRWLNESRTWDRRQSEVNAALGFVL